MGFFLLLLFVLIVIACHGEQPQERIYSGRYKTGTILSNREKTAEEKLDDLELSNVGLRLNCGEACYFEGEGYSNLVREVVTGYRYHSFGSSSRIMKGYSFHSSYGRKDSIRETVKTKYSGKLFITNQRIVFLAERLGFDVRFDKLANITMHNKYLEVFAGNKCYKVYTPYMSYIRDLFALMNDCYQEQYCLV